MQFANRSARHFVYTAAVLASLAASVHAGTWSVSPLVLSPAGAADASTGISTTKTYTHAVDIASDDGGSSINGVNLVIGGAVGPNFSYTGLNNVFQGNGAGNGNNLDTASGIFDLTEDFLYGGAPGGIQTLTLTGLTPNTPYIASFYVAGFSGSGQILTADDPGFTSLATDRGDEKIIRYAYTLGAGDTNIVFTFDAVNDTDTFHHYGFTNEVVPEPAAFGLFALGSLSLLSRRRR